MPRKSTRKTKSKIVSAAWKLFYDQGYDNTTIEEIIAESGTSRGSFYHYFEGKDALLGSLSYMFDEKYEELEEQLKTFGKPHNDESEEQQKDSDSIGVLLFLNRELFQMIENSVDFDLLCRLLASQLTTNGEKHLLDRNRTYYKLLRKIILQGQQAGEITDRFTVNELVKHYALCERGMMYDWCLSNADYSLTEYAKNFMPGYLEAFRA